MATADEEQLSAGSTGNENTMMKKMKSEAGTKEMRERIAQPLPWLRSDDLRHGRGEPVKTSLGNEGPRGRQKRREPGSSQP